MDTSEIDAFLAEPKTLLGPFPEWKKNQARPGEYENTWLIADSLGIVRAQLRFRFSTSNKAFPSVSLIYRTLLIWRIDLVPPDECKFNMLGAAALGLPARVCGSHSHSWPDNRDYVQSQGFGQMPYRRPIPVQVRKLEQAVLLLATEIGLVVAPEQRGFDVPPQSTLFDE
jgi:hypothetical protein